MNERRSELMDVELAVDFFLGGLIVFTEFAGAPRKHEAALWSKRPVGQESCVDTLGVVAS